MLRSVHALALATAVAGTLALSHLGAAQAPARAVRANQVGYATRAPKLAIVDDGSATRFAVVDATRGDTVFRGALSEAATWPPSRQRVRRADFSRLTTPGRYVIVAGEARSAPFVVAPDALTGVARAAIKGFYFQRASTPLEPRWAGAWSREAGHPDTAVLVHPSAASAGRPAGTVIRSPGGWYDAGDYNKYVVNSGISTYTLLLVTEQYPKYAASLRTDIPESGGVIPDALAEALWNLRWMLTMQDPTDGGVYHKLTTAEFSGFVAPSRDQATRYVVQKSTAAALDLAAVAAHASLVVGPYRRELPGLGDSLVRAATAAWRWAVAHPDSIYDQSRLNARYAPAIHTGEYGDTQVGDERLWAAAELFLATGDRRYLSAARALAEQPATVPSWGSVATLGLYSLVDRRQALPAAERRGFERRLVALADSLAAAARRSAYGVAMEAPRDFEWGSNAVDANQGMALVEAYRLTRDTAYLTAAVGALDYLLGRNALGRSFVTGLGATPPMSPHHRPSRSDTVAAPVPGLLVGGPNPGQQDHCAGYVSSLPALSYMDDVCSYSTNEIAINWNAPLAFLASALDAIYTRAPVSP